jgi:signal transduction histidine kinase
MNSLEHQLNAEIEVERLWVTTRQGKYVFFVMLPFTILIVVGLWHSASHSLLLFWALLLTAINLFRWIVLHYYHVHKDALVNNVPKFKRLIMFGAALNGFWWVMCQVFFLDANDPVNVLVITVPTITQVVGVMLTWFTYFPAVLVVNIPATIAIDYFLLAEGNGNYIVPAIIFSMLPIISIPSSLRLAGMLNHALRLNFENAALRRESEEKSLLLETALENMGQGISMSDKDDLLRMWNRQFTTLLGGDAGPVDTHSQLSALLAAAHPPITVSTEGSSNYRGPDGKVYEVRQAELAHGGRVVTYNDISDLIKREQALEKARKEAEQANAAKTRFLASASHDLRQPIHALGLFFAELSDRVHSPETATLIGQIEDSIAAINSMLNALLDVSKLDAGVVKPAIEPFSLDELFQRLQAEFQPIALENQNELKIRPTRATVNTDPAMLERILRNLISNALRHTQDGRILVAARPRGEQLAIQVIDTGPGIPDNQLEEIFIEFHQLNNPARDRRQGLGLGLAIVKRLGKLLHHDIKVLSRLGHGSCFAITLPTAPAVSELPNEQNPPLAVSPLQVLTGRHLLVIDDEIAVLESMQGLLSRWGCHVTTACTLAEMLGKLTVHPPKPELLIVDYRLADHVSGIDVARALRAYFGEALAVLIVTGDTGPERLREADASGFPLLHKPVQPAKLRSTLQYLLSKPAAQTEATLRPA